MTKTNPYHFSARPLDMTMPISRKGVKQLYKVTVVLTALLLATSGCVDLKEIRAFSDTAAQVGDAFPSLARDFYESCMSQQRYIVAQRQDFRFDQFADLNDDQNPMMAAGVTTCKLFKDEQDRLIKANGTLVSYMKTMGDLAADDLTNFDQGIAGFGAALTGAQLFDEAESSAIANLASYLVRVATEGYRRNKLRDVIKETNSDVKVITSSLGRIVNMNYVLQLENERVAMREYYRKLAVKSVEYSRLAVTHAQGATDIGNPVPLDDLKSKYETRNAVINDKIIGAKAYAKVLETVAKGHQQLNDNADKLNSRAVLTAAIAEARTIQGLATDFLKAFG